MDARIAQMNFQDKHGITSREQLRSYRKPLEEQAITLTKERYRLYRLEPDSPRIHEITILLKPLRKEIRMCTKIEQHSLEIEKKLEALNQQSERQLQRQENRIPKVKNELEERR